MVILVEVRHIALLQWLGYNSRVIEKRFSDEEMASFRYLPVHACCWFIHFDYSKLR